MLITQRPADDHLTAEGTTGDRRSEPGRIRGWHDLRQHRLRDAEQLQQFWIPLEGFQVHQHGATGVRHVGDVPPTVHTAGQVPQQPTVRGAEDRLTRSGGLGQPVDVVQHPLDLAAGEVAGRRQARTFLDQLGVPGPLEVGRDLGRSGVLPHDGVAVRFAGLRVPHHRRLALVRDAERSKIICGEFGGAQCALDDLTGPLPDLAGTVLDPAGPRQDLLVLQLVPADLTAGVVEDHAAGTGRALVDCCDEAGHGRTLFRSVVHVTATSAA